MTEYIIQGIVAILAVGISAGFLARRKRLIKEGKYQPKGPGIRQCDWADIRTDGVLDSIPYKTVDPNIYSKHSTDSQGNQRWTNGRDQLHRKDGPAIIWKWGTKDWYLNGQRHREDGPATEYATGGKYWYLNGNQYTEEEWKKELNKPKCETDSLGNKRWYNKEYKYHREDGPALDFVDHHKSWYINGQYHREDGPAREWSEGRKEWWLNGKSYTEEEWKKALNKQYFTIDGAGSKCWINKEGNFHREDGPAIEWENGSTFWYLNGLSHREDGPACEYMANGRKRWFLNGNEYTEEEWKKALNEPKPDCLGNKYWIDEGKLHRIDGPAIVMKDGYKSWHISGQYHRTDGPARIWPDGRQEWYLNGKNYTEEEWKQELNKPKCGRPNWGSNSCKSWTNKEGQFHREDGPAFEDDGYKAWWINGKRHREDGPACEYADGRKEWFLNGKKYTEEEWKKELDKPKCETDGHGNKRWKNKEGKIHREDGPAFETPQGYKQWIVNGQFHREDGPAIENAAGLKQWFLNGICYSTEEAWKKELSEPKPDCLGNKSWYKEGKLHREDGPAIIWKDGSTFWYSNGLCHREDGPACEYMSNGRKTWFLNGINYTEEDWKRELNKPTCTIDENGTKIWHKDGIWHREDGPAREQKSGVKSWWINGQRHREDGPAIERPDGSKEWWLKDKFLTETEWKHEVSKLARS